MLEQLDLKVQTAEVDSKNILPNYLVELLIYFYMKTSKYYQFKPIRKFENG